MKFEGPHSKDLAPQIAVGATTKDTIESSSIIRLLKGHNGRMVLIGAGYTDTAEIKLYFPVVNYIRPDSALKKIDVDPEEITDLIITHPHLDHIGGIDLFPNAMLWMQKDDFGYFVHLAWQKNGFAEGFNKKDVFKLVQKSLDGHF